MTGGFLDDERDLWYFSGVTSSTGKSSSGAGTEGLGDGPNGW